MTSEQRIYPFVKGESDGGKDMKQLVRFASSRFLPPL